MLQHTFSNEVGVSWSTDSTGSPNSEMWNYRGLIQKMLGQKPASSKNDFNSSSC